MEGKREGERRGRGQAAAPISTLRVAVGEGVAVGGEGEQYSPTVLDLRPSSRVFSTPRMKCFSSLRLAVLRFYGSVQR